MLAMHFIISTRIRQDWRWSVG